MPHLYNRPQQAERRRALRNEPTSAEHALWRVLKGRALRGPKFRRQHGVGPYIVDFYCPEERLVVELDGVAHNDPARAHYDGERQRYLEGLGIRVVRFENRVVWEHTEAILALIASYFRGADSDG